jgi:ATP-dependent protease ClpP protease subunit
MNLEINIRGEIGWDVFYWDVAEKIQSADMSKVDKIVLHIDSYGGEVFEGYSIFQEVTMTGKPVEARIYGKCMSIATVIALAGINGGGNRVLMPKFASSFMIHSPWSSGAGNDEEMGREAQRLKVLKDDITNIYKAKTGAEFNTISNLMSEEKFFDFSEAVAFGFVDGEHVPSEGAGVRARYGAKCYYNMAKIDLLQKWNAKNETKTKTKMAMIFLTTADGIPIEIDANAIEEISGADVFGFDSDKNKIVLEDGEYELTGFFAGTTLVVNGGTVESMNEIMEDEEEPTDEPMEPQAQAQGEEEEEEEEQGASVGDLELADTLADLKNQINQVLSLGDRLEKLESNFQKLNLGNQNPVPQKKPQNSGNEKLSRDSVRSLLSPKH